MKVYCDYSECNHNTDGLCWLDSIYVTKNRNNPPFCTDYEISASSNVEYVSEEEWMELK